MGRPPKPPFDPIWGAWVILLGLLGTIALQQLLIFAGCLFGVQAMCTRTGETLTSVALEVLTAVAILLGIGKK
jgi:hypothetical protein